MRCHGIAVDIVNTSHAQAAVLLLVLVLVIDTPHRNTAESRTATTDN